jgi:exosortase/archaeosortase family protein
MLKNNTIIAHPLQTLGNIIDTILDNKVVLSKAAVIIVSVAVLYYSDMGVIFGNALEFTTGNISNYVITIPFLSAFIIYRKRNILRATATLGKGSSFGRVRFDDVLGVTLCAVAVIIYLAGSATLYALEYHILTMPIFLAGSTILVFNFATFRHAFVAIMLTLYLQPPPGQIVSELAADLSWTSAVIVETLLVSLGLQVSLDSSLGAPALVIQGIDGTQTPFFVGEPSSGVFSTIGLSLFAVFVAYIIRGPTWKRLVLFASGFPLFYLLNTLRIAVVLSLWYLWGRDVSEAYHTISGSSMVAIGTLIILLVGEKALKLNIRTRAVGSIKCRICDKCSMTREIMCLSCGRLLGKMKQTFGKSTERIATLTFITLIAASLVVTITYGGSTGRRLSDLDITKIQGPETTEYLLPEIPGWELRYAYRDTRVESVLNQDAALAFRYIPESPDGSGTDTTLSGAVPSIYSSVQISTGHHVWEDSLVTFPSRVGRPGATLLESDDIAISGEKDGRFLLFKRLGSTSTEAVIYWFERTPLKFGANFENRNILVSIWANTESLAKTGIIASADDSEGIKNLYLSLAKPIAKYWDEQSESLGGSNELLFAFVNRNIHALIIVIFIPVVLFRIYQVAKKTPVSSRMRALYTQLRSEDKRFIEAAIYSVSTSKPSTGDSIAKRYTEISNQQLSDEQLAHMLDSARRTGLVTDAIASINDESLLVWQVNFNVKTREAKDASIAKVRDLWRVFQLKSSRNEGTAKPNYPTTDTREKSE